MNVKHELLDEEFEKKEVWIDKSISHLCQVMTFADAEERSELRR